MLALGCDALDIDDGPPCPVCGSTRWHVQIEASDAHDGADTLRVELHLVAVSCHVCSFDVDMSDDDDPPGSMRWQPDPTDTAPRDLP